VHITIAAGSPAVKVPANVELPAGELQARFQAYVDDAAMPGLVLLEAGDGDSSVREYLNVLPGGVRQLPVKIDTPEPPSPVISELRNRAGFGARAACSPGSVATLIGTGLSPNAEVLVNRRSVRVLRESDDRVDFLCPATADAALEIQVQTSRGASNILKSVMAGTAPGVFVLDGIPGQSQAMAFVSSRFVYAALPTFWYAGTPAVAGGPLTIIGTGVNSQGLAPKVRVGDQYATIQSLDCSPETGECAISVQLPGSIYGDSVPVVLESLDPDGKPVQSNRAFVAIDRRP
jgi:uncharacterized protein (TIGR03437 family)